jgi:carbon monoxide dehydrogenase subunit G
MKALKIVAIVLALLVALVALAIMVLPSQSHVERSIVINSTPNKIYPVVDGFTYFKQWSPWVKKDSLTKYEFSGGMSGVGATMKWESKKVGNGTQKTVEADPNKRVKSEIEFDGMGASTAEFILVPEGATTKVTWTLDSKLSGIGKVFGPFMDGMVGPDYELGLNNLKQYVESLPAETPKPDSLK